MTNAKRDNNQIPTVTGTSNADGSTPTLIKVNPTTHVTQIDDGTTGSDLSGDNALRDDNSVPVILGVSEVDGVTPVPIYTDPANGKLLVDST